MTLNARAQFEDSDRIYMHPFLSVGRAVVWLRQRSKVPLAGRFPLRGAGVPPSWAKMLSVP